MVQAPASSLFRPITLCFPSPRRYDGKNIVRTGGRFPSVCRLRLFQGLMVSFLHAADLHLGLRITRFAREITSRIREARFQALEKIREHAKNQQVQFVIIAGDLFDDHAVDADLARRAFDLLESFPCAVYVLSGNHDPLLPGSVWDRPPWNQPAPKRICLFRDARPVSAGSDVTLYPCPVLRKTSLNDPTRWIAEAARDDSSIRLGIAHGSLRIRDDLPADDHLIAPQAAH